MPSTRPPQLPKSLLCVDYHQDRSLVVLVGDSSLSSSSNGSSGTPFRLSVLYCYIHHLLSVLHYMHMLGSSTAYSHCMLIFPVLIIICSFWRTYRYTTRIYLVDFKHQKLLPIVAVVSSEPLFLTFFSFILQEHIF
jgi:hypothetical protein